MCSFCIGFWSAISCIKLLKTQCFCSFFQRVVAIRCIRLRHGAIIYAEVMQKLWQTPVHIETQKKWKAACITFVSGETTLFAYESKQNEVNPTSVFWGFGSESQCYKMHKIQVVCDSYAEILKNYTKQPVLLNCTSSRCKCATLQFQNHNCQENEFCLVQCSHLYKFFFF